MLSLSDLSHFFLSFLPIVCTVPVDIHHTFYFIKYLHTLPSIAFHSPLFAFCFLEDSMEVLLKLGGDFASNFLHLSRQFCLFLLCLTSICEFSVKFVCFLFCGKWSNKHFVLSFFWKDNPQLLFKADLTSAAYFRPGQTTLLGIT